MSQVRCTCGAVVVDIPGTLPTVFLTPCPDCDPEGYARRWSCPWPHHAPDTDIAYLRRRVAVLEGQVADIRGDLATEANRRLVLMSLAEEVQTAVDDPDGSYEAWADYAAILRAKLASLPDSVRPISRLAGLIERGLV